MINPDRATARDFKVDAEGRLVFYPYGMLGKGRILPDRATAAAVYARQKLLYQMAAAGVAVLLFAYNRIGLAWTAGLAAALCVVLWLCMYPVIRRLPISGERYDFGESVQGDGRSRLRLLSLVSLVLMAGSVLVLIVGKPEDRWIGLGGIAFFGFAFLMFVWRSVSEARQRRRSAEAETVRRRAGGDSAVVSRRASSPSFGRRSKPL